MWMLMWFYLVPFLIFEFSWCAWWVGAAIGICFSMTDIYRSEILAVVMNQLVDEPTLPTLFLRTVSNSTCEHRGILS